MPRPPQPCAWRALALVVLVLLGPHQEHSSVADAARIRATGTDAAGRAAQDPAKSDGPWKRDAKRLKVVYDALSDMLANINKEEQQEAQNIATFQKWCGSEVGDFQKILDQALLVRDEKSVTMKELEATIAKLENDLSLIQKQEQETSDELAQEQQIDKEDDKKYEQDMTLNTQAASQVTEAVKIVGKVHEQGGFLQNGVLTQVQLNEPGESSYVLGIMKQLRKTLADTRTKLMDSQKIQEEDSSALVHTKRQQLQSLAQEKSGKSEQLTQARVDLEEVKRDLNRSLTKIPRVEKRIDETKAHCDAKEKAWKARKADRKAEKDSIAEALGFLTQSVMETMSPNVSAIAQPSSPSWQSFGSGETSSAEPPAFVQASSKSARSSRAGSLAYLSALADRQSGNEVKKVVKDMAAVLQKQQKDEDALVQQCKASLDSKNDDVAQNKDDIARLVAGINFKDSEILSLSAEVTELKQALADLQSNLENATAMRKEEKKMYESQSKDRKLSIKVVKQSMQVLKKFYSTKDVTAFARVLQQAPSSALQLGEDLVVVDVSEAPGGNSDTNITSPTAPPATWSGSSRKTLAGAGIMGLLAKLRDDMSAEQRTADIEEQEAVTAFEKLQKDSRSQFDDSMAEITERMKRKATLTVKLNSDKEDKAGEEEELGTIEGQLKALHKKCDEVMQTIKDRTKARDFEISQLRDVLDIISGSQLAVRTGA